MLLTLVILSALALALVTAGYVVRSRQGLASLQAQVQRAWDEMDALLLQRHDALEQLAHAASTPDLAGQPALERVRHADAAVHSARARQDVTAVGIAEEHLRKALSSPAGRRTATEPVSTLAATVRALTDRIAARSDAYNEAVNLYNIRLRSWPEVAIGRVAGLRPAPLLEFPGS